jgi:hypothetical protein
MNQLLPTDQVDQFIADGYVKLEQAFPSDLAEEVCGILWKDMDCSPDNPTSWRNSVIRLDDYSDEPFRKAANTPILHIAFDQLIGVGRWIPRQSLGTFAIRFPVEGDPNDTGWHVDAGFPGEDLKNFSTWRINVNTRRRALLMLFLFSDIGIQDAPTRIRAGSHLDVVKILEPAGSEGISFLELAGQLDRTAGRK